MWAEGLGLCLAVVERRGKLWICNAVGVVVLLLVVNAVGMLVIRKKIDFEVSKLTVPESQRTR